MASTYENDLRLQEIGTGEQSGTWGTTTNTNLELIGEALSYSATGEAIANASTHTITVADGVADEARCFYLKCTGGGQACTVTLAPNSLSKVWVIENTTSYTLTFSQGSGANVAILAGQVKMIATDGAGSGAAIYDLMQDLAVPDLFVDDDLTLQSDAAVLGFGADKDTTLTHVADTGLLLNSTRQLQFGDSGTYIHQSADGVLDLVSDTEIEINATTVDLNGNLDVSGTYTGGGLMTTGGNIVIPDAGNIGSASDTNAIAIGADGDVTLTQDLELQHDAATLSFGADNDVILTHVADTGLLLNSTMQLQFNDASQYINAPSATVLDINATDEIELNATLIDVNGNLDVSGTSQLTGVVTFTATPVFSSDITIEDDLFLDSDAAVIHLGEDGDVTLTHVADTGILLNSTMQLQFNDASQYINAPSATVLDINATDEVELNATLVDINANLEVSGTAAITGIATFTDDIIIGDGKTIGSASDVDAMTIASNGQVTFTQTLIGTALDISGDIDVDGTTNLDVVDIDGAVDMASTLTVGGIIKTDDTTDATSTTDGSLQTDGGLSVAKDAVIGDDLKLLSDAAVLGFGADNDVTLTHVADTGLLLNGTMALQFNDASQSINAPSNTVLDINATDEIELNATLVDANANLDVSGTYTGGGLMTTGGNIVIPDSGNIGSASDTDAIAIASNGQVTLTQTLIGTALDISGDIDVDGTTNLDVVDIDGAVDMASTLQVDGAITSSAGMTATQVDIGNGSAGGTSEILFSDNVSARGKIKYNHGSSPEVMTLETTGTVALTIDNSQNVGIGASSPQDLLHLSTTNAASHLRVQRHESDEALSDGDEIGAVEFWANDSTSFSGASTLRAAIRAEVQNTSLGTRLEFYTGNSSSTAAEAMRIIADGKVAIGGGFTAEHDLHVKTLGQTEDGIIKIGGSDTTLGLEISYDQSSVTTTKIISNPTYGNTAAVMHIAVDGDTNPNQLVLKGDGTVNIGDGSDIITASAGTDNVRLGVNAGNSILSGGNYNTLIGDEAGTALTTGTNNVAIGFQALDAEDGHGYNVAIGRSALSVLNAGADGYNVAVGHAAGDAMSTGTKNIAVGAFAMDAIVTGTENIAVGYEAATDLTSGTGNVVIGQEAGNNITDSDDNVVIGKAALQAVAGGNNIAIGAQALRVNTSSSNLAIGHSALKANTSGLYNVAIGHEAMITNIDGDGAVAVGYEALKAQEPSNGLTYNVAIGYEAGNDVSTGTGNTFVGGAAGDKVTSGSANVAIGQEAGGSGAASTGSHNTSVGLQAGAVLTTGNQNVFMGNYTCDAVTKGRYNVAIGYSTLSSETVGDRTTAVGYQSAFYQVAGSDNAEMQNSYYGMYAGHYNVTGTKNTSMGYQAGMGAHTNSASNNVAIGVNAGLICRGDNNTLVGALAGDAITTGDTNCAFGKSALTAVNTGTNNVGLGQGAGSGITTGATNTILGDATGQNIAGGSSNIMIGYGCTASASDANHNYCLGYEVVGAVNTFTFGQGGNDSRVANGATTITAPSDVRLKEDIQDETVGLGFINDLRPVTFQWKKEKDIPSDMNAHVAGSEKRTMNGKHNHGFIAQEVKAVIDNHNMKDGFDMWTEDGADGRQRVGDASLMPIMVKAVQELSTKLDAALARIEELEG